MPHDRRVTPDRVVLGQLHDGLKAIEDDFQADALTMISQIAGGIDGHVRDAVEARIERHVKAGESAPKSLVVLLETTGGYIELAERIADTFRVHYDRVDFVVPNYAFSAGTVLVMSGDAIHMDYYSVLGPIDPQVDNGEGRLVPALGYLKKYDDLILKSQSQQLSDAELFYLIKQFDPAELYDYEQARELSITLLKGWLKKFKFKDWDSTETQKVKVTPELREERAKDIADKLLDTARWHSHSRGIPMKELREYVNLKIDDFGEDDARSSRIRDYYRLLTGYMRRVGTEYVVHTFRRFQPIEG